MDLNLVSAFVRVVEAQSFTLAAKSMGLPKSSVSRRVTELESELGVQLLQRTTRRLSLTEAGRSYFEEAERALAGLEAAADAAAGIDTDPRGIVRVTTAVDFGVLGLAQVLGEFSQKYPDIHVELSLNSRIVNLVEEGFDIAIRAGRTRDASLVTRRIGSADLGIYASPAYLERHKRPRQLSDLAQHDCVLFHAKYGKTIWRLHGPNDEISTVEVKGPVSTDELLFVYEGVENGLGIGLLPIFAVIACAEHAKLDVERILPDYSVRGNEVHILVPPMPKRPRRVTLLRDFLIEKLSPRCG
jgi:DNA-binding transcriptional LysR family regulator